MLFRSNRIVIDQLTLGENVDSPDAMKLPLKLAVALLKDSNGVIDLDLPVRGDLNEPEFRYGPLIGKAILGLLTKIITSPFAALGSLLGSDAEELSWVSFTAGDVLLDEADQEKLSRLAKALTERPALQLEVRGAVATEADRAVLAERMLLSQLREADAAQDEPLSKKEKKKLLKLFNKSFDEKPKTLLPPLADGDEERSRDEEEALIADAAYAKLVTAMPVTEQELRTLAQSRAQAIQEFLVTQGGFDPQRIFLLEIDADAAAEEGEIRTPLTLQAQ